MRSARVIIEGRVQGVAFRHWTAATATSLGLDGWVRNRRNGTVEAAFSGDKGAVARMIALCHAGPRAASVRDVRIVAEGENVDAGFTTWPTE